MDGGFREEAAMACGCCSGRGNGSWVALGTAVGVAVLMPLLVLGGKDEGRAPSGGEMRVAQSGSGPGELVEGALAAGEGERDAADVLVHRMRLIDGTPKDLADFRGKAVLLVNTASRCGLTRQYAALEDLYKEHQEAGLVVLGFPANDFMGQEPGTNEQIAEFCSTEFGVSFPMFEKIAVTGADRHPLFDQLARLPEPLGGEPAWNFTKYLVDRSGRVVARFEPKVAPDDPQVIEAIERLLAAPAGG